MYYHLCVCCTDNIGKSHKLFTDSSDEPGRKRECSGSSSSGLSCDVVWAEFQRFMASCSVCWTLFFIILFQYAKGSSLTHTSWLLQNFFVPTQLVSGWLGETGLFHLLAPPSPSHLLDWVVLILLPDWHDPLHLFVQLGLVHQPGLPHLPSWTGLLLLLTQVGSPLLVDRPGLIHLLDQVHLLYRLSLVSCLLYPILVSYLLRQASLLCLLIPSFFTCVSQWEDDNSDSLG